MNPCVKRSQDVVSYQHSAPLFASHLSLWQEVTQSSWWQIKRQKAACPPADPLSTIPCAGTGDGLTGAVLVVSVPGDGGYEVDAGESRHEALETVSLAAL